jgi:allantoin racemase
MPQAMSANSLKRGSLMDRDQPMAESSARVWYQSFVHPIEQGPYIERLQAFLDSAAGPGIRYEVHGLDPPDRHFHPLTEFRCAAQVIRNAIEAERAGYDAFVIGHFQEPGLLEIRGTIDIPVVGLGEANLLAALSMGGKLGLVTIDPVFITWHERQVMAHGLDQRVVGVSAISADLPGFMSAFTDDVSYARVREQFVTQVQPLVAGGAEVILPAGGLPMLLFSRECPFLIDGALVLNGIAVVAKAAEMAIALRRLTGSVVSRRGTYAKASAACMDEYLNTRW